MKLEELIAALGGDEEVAKLLLSQRSLYEAWTKLQLTTEEERHLAQAKIVLINSCLMRMGYPVWV